VFWVNNGAISIMDLKVNKVVLYFSPIRRGPSSSRDNFPWRIHRHGRVRICANWTTAVAWIFPREVRKYGSWAGNISPWVTPTAGSGLFSYCSNAWFYIYILGKPIPLQALRLPDFKTIGTWRLSALRTGRPYPRKHSCYSFLLEAESTPGP
jgi:hypothetical protein